MAQQHSHIQISEDDEQQSFDPDPDEAINLENILKLHDEVTANIRLKLRNEDNNFKICYFKFLRTYGKIVTKCRGHSPITSLASVFVYFGKQQNNTLLPVLHNTSRIRVQPTSICRIKSRIKSSSAQPPSPKPKLQTGRKRKWNTDDKEAMKIKKLAKKKRQHSLSTNMKINVQNAGPKR